MKKRPFHELRPVLESWPESAADLPEAEPASDEHLDDAEFVAWAADTLGPERRAECRRHLARCLDCAEEVARIGALGSGWNDPSTVRRLQALRMTPAPVSPVSLLSDLFESARIALASLAPPRGAFASDGSEGTPQPLYFVVEADGYPVAGLVGTVLRRDRAYYARIDLDGPKDILTASRSVVLTIRDPNLPAPILCRRLELGVAVLLGTDLPLTEMSTLEARLFTSEDAVEGIL